MTLWHGFQFIFKGELDQVFNVLGGKQSEQHLCFYGVQRSYLGLEKLCIRGCLEFRPTNKYVETTGFLVIF